MLSYIKGNLTSIDGIEIFPIISLVIFFTFFVGLGIYILRADRKTIEEIKRIPLDEE
ncbi:MAG: cbb3-type cytochrome c oxidase subunit 3 [Crocinitomicaceae bacterium]|jgi:cytochrome c oxidase cbb3-type subunit 4|nr:cbb3-type cytochrome c oxidase subunit 3 [Crocinitomicaceae bacterium]MBK6951883.1 cbb3-type cytochrome c oxidase subunit 3 [Crocinitomicaceae bacterium]MBK9590862.1 cbb3-type cytochrome c oxidase subunit 3 [Crocinitomicaceae bacterium]